MSYDMLMEFFFSRLLSLYEGWSCAYVYKMFIIWCQITTQLGGKNWITIVGYAIIEVLPSKVISYKSSKWWLFLIYYQGFRAWLHICYTILYCYNVFGIPHVHLFLKFAKIIGCQAIIRHLIVSETLLDLIG